jgi:hypothetical protein
LRRSAVLEGGCIAQARLTALRGNDVMGQGARHLGLSLRQSHANNCWLRLFSGRHYR